MSEKHNTTQNTILHTIYQDVDKINWTSNNVRLKAHNFIVVLFNTSLYKHKSLSEFKSMSREYWSTIIGGSNRHINEIKSKLVSNNILIVKSGLYNKDNRVLSYKFNNNYISNYSYNSPFTIIAVSFHNNLEIKELEIIESETKKVLNNVKVRHVSPLNLQTIVDTQINKIKIFDIKKTLVSHIEVKLEDKNYRYEVNNAVKFAVTLNQILIKYKDSYYFVDSIEKFKEYKRKELTLLYSKQLFDIENNIIHVSRNNVNNRLDTNVTNLKSELWEYLRLDNEEMIECDISNSQFAIAANKVVSDELFKELSINGRLYKYIAKEMNITTKDAKSLMFRVAFDKVKDNQEPIRKLFPIFMNSVDTYKKENGYKSFSNLLQREESSIMIDNVLHLLLKEGFKVLSVHDSIRCKKSDYIKVSIRIKEIFNSIGFKATLKEKNTNIIDTKESPLDVIKIVSKDVIKSITKDDYRVMLKNTFPEIQSQKWYREIKLLILDDLYENQITKKKDVIEIINKHTQI